MGVTVLVVDDGEGLAPVALAGEQPVAQLVLDLLVASTFLLQPLNDGGDGDVLVQAIDVQAGVIGGVHARTVTDVRLLCNVTTCNNLADWQTEGSGELVVALIVGRDSHDGTGAVANQDVVGNEYRHLFAADRVGGVSAQEDAGLLLVLLALQVGLGGNCGAVSGDGLGWGFLAEGPALIHTLVGTTTGFNQLIHQLVLRSEHHVGGSEESVRASGEDPDLGGDLRADLSCEVNLGTAGATDPVALHGLDLVRPVQQLQVVDQAVSVCGDAHHPLAQPLAEHREVTALRTTFGGHFLVGQHSAEARAPVDHRIRLVNQAELIHSFALLSLAELSVDATVLGSHLARLQQRNQLIDATGLLLILIEPGVVNLQENPLRPLVVVLVSGRENTTAVMAKPQAAQLALHVGDIRFRRHARVRTGLDCELLRRQTEGVVAQGVQHVCALHAVEAREDVGGDVSQRVAYVQTDTGRVREHVLDEKLVLRRSRAVGSCQIAHRVGGVEGAVIFPIRLPLSL